MARMDSLNLSVPLQHDCTDPTVELDVARLREWLANLPLMNVVETVRLVQGALGALNEQKLDDRLRFRLLEAYRPVLLRLFYALDPLHLRQLSLSRSARQTAIDGLARLLQDLACGYKLVVRSQHADAAHGNALFGHALNRALELLVFELLDEYRFYRALPAALIGELHVLYRTARHHGLLGVSASSAEEAYPARASAALYHAAMLLALTDPERLAEGEVGTLFEVLLQHADQCRVIPGNHWEGSGEGLFLLDLRTRSAPLACAGLTRPAAAQEPYLLDATRALQALHGQLAQTPEPVRRQSPEAMLLRRLLPEQGAERQRRETRQRDGRYVAVLTGLEALHAWLRAQRELTASVVNALPQCRVMDSSRSGMKLSRTDAVAGDVRVGELLGVIEGGGNRYTLRAAIVRSIRVHREGGLEAGILLLEGGLGAVTCSIPEVPASEAIPALFMPAAGEEAVAATLVAAKGLYTFGRSLVIDVGGREVSIRAGRRVFDSPVFDRFEFAARSTDDDAR
jgi:hypothetical protein